MSSTPPPSGSGSSGGTTSSGSASGGAPFAPLPPPSGKSRRGLKFFGSIAAAAVLAAAFVGACVSCNKLGGGNGETTAAAPATAKPGDSGTANTDPLKPPPAPSATAVAGGPECPDGSLWDTKKKVCVQPAPPFPSSITVIPGCPPTNCPMASAAPVASASAPPASSGKAPPAKPAATLVKVDLTDIGNPALFPSGQ